MADRDTDNRFSANLRFRKIRSSHGESGENIMFDAPKEQPHLPPEVGRGELRLESLSSGLVLAEIQSSKATEDVELRIELSAPMYKLTFHLLESSQEVGLEGVRKLITLRHGDSYLLSPEAIGTMYIPRGSSSHQSAQGKI